MADAVIVRQQRAPLRQFVCEVRRGRLRAEGDLERLVLQHDHEDMAYFWLVQRARAARGRRSAGSERQRGHRGRTDERTNAIHPKTPAWMFAAQDDESMTLTRPPASPGKMPRTRRCRRR